MTHWSYSRLYVIATSTDADVHARQRHSVCTALSSSICNQAMLGALNSSYFTSSADDMLLSQARSRNVDCTEQP